MSNKPKKLNRVHPLAARLSPAALERLQEIVGPGFFAAAKRTKRERSARQHRTTAGQRVEIPRPPRPHKDPELVSFERSQAGRKGGKAGKGSPAKSEAARKRQLILWELRHAGILPMPQGRKNKVLWDIVAPGEYVPEGLQAKGVES